MVGLLKHASREWQIHATRVPAVLAVPACYPDKKLRFPCGLAAAHLSAQQRVIELLRTLAEARVDRTGRADGNGVLLMPSMWNEGSYAELEARLIDLRYERSLWWHVCHRYRFGTTRIILAPVIRRIRYGQREPTVSLPKRCELVAGVPVHEVQAGSRLARCRICSGQSRCAPSWWPRASTC